MHVTYSVYGNQDDADKVEELKKKIEELIKGYELDGASNGNRYATSASYSGNFRKPKPVTNVEFDPSQYVKKEKEIPQFDLSQYTKKDKKVQAE